MNKYESVGELAQRLGDKLRFKKDLTNEILIITNDVYKFTGQRSDGYRSEEFNDTVICGMYMNSDNKAVIIFYEKVDEQTSEEWLPAIKLKLNKLFEYAKTTVIFAYATIYVCTENMFRYDFFKKLGNEKDITIKKHKVCQHYSFDKYEFIDDMKKSIILNIENDGTRKWLMVLLNATNNLSFRKYPGGDFYFMVQILKIAMTN